MARKTPEINSSSTADMAFILLCFFLMTTTMDQDKGLQRRLPPMPDPNQKAEDQKVNRRNIIVVKINSADRLLAGLVAVAAIAAVAYVLAPGTPAVGYLGEPVSDGTLKLTDTILNLTYFTFGVAILSLVVGWIVGATRK